MPLKSHSIIICSIVLLAWMLSWAPCSGAANLRSVQSGTVASTGNGTVSVAITPVNMNRAYLVFQSRHSSNRPPGSTIIGKLAASNRIDFERVTNESSTMNITWYLIEYSSGVSVQRGDVQQTSDNQNITLPIALTDVDHAFVLHSKVSAASHSAYGEDDPIYMRLTSETNLNIRVSDGNNTHRVHWQVVEYTDGSVTVQTGSDSLTNDSATVATDTFGTAVDQTKTILLAGYYSADTGSDIGERMVLADFEDDDTVRFTRGRSGGDDLDGIGYQLIEFNDETRVLRGNITFDPGETNLTVTFSAIDPASAFALASVQTMGGQNMGNTNYQDDDIIGETAFTMEITSPTTMALRRSASSSTATVRVQLVALPAPVAISCTEPPDTDYALYSDGGGARGGSGSRINGNNLPSGSVGGTIGVLPGGGITTTATTIPELQPPDFPTNNATQDADDSDSPINVTSETFFDDINVGRDDTLTITGGGTIHIDSLTLDRRATLRLAAGTYFVDDLEMAERQGEIQIISSPVNLFIGNRFRVQSSDALVNANGGPADLRVFLYTDATFEANDEDLEMSATMLGPDAGRIDLGESVNFTGIAHSAGGFEYGDDARFTLTSAQQAQIAAVSICTGDGAGVDYFELAHDTAGIHCVPETITVTAKDSSAETVLTYAESITLDTQTGKGTWSLSSGSGSFSDPTPNDGLASYTFVEADNGTATFLLSYQEGAATTDIDVYQTNDSTLRDDDSEGDIDWGISGYTLTNSALPNPPPSPINDPVEAQTAGTSFNVHIAAYGQTADDPVCGIIESYTGDKDLKFWVDYSNPGTGTLVPTVNGTTTASSEVSATLQSITFTNGQAVVSTKYKDAGAIQLMASDGTNDGGSNTFVVKPAGLFVSDVRTADGDANPGASTANGAGFVAAGEAFSVTVEARDAEGDLTPNFGLEAAPEGIRLESGNLVLPASGRNGPLDSGAMGNSTAFFATSTAGRFLNVSAYFNEVGIIQLQASVADGDYLGTTDNLVGALSGNVGRFYPATMNLIGGSGVSGSCNNTTYMGEPALWINYTLEAQGQSGNLLFNYDNTLLGGNVASVNLAAENANTGFNLSSRLTASTSSWQNGIYTVNSTASVFSRSASADGPYDNLAVGVSLTDVLDGRNVSNRDMNPVTSDDCSASASCTAKQLGGTTSVRYGRLEVRNSYGPETSALEVPLRITYSNAIGTFSTQSADDCFNYINTAASLANYQNGLPAVSVTAPVSNTSLVDGVTPASTSLFLSPPGAGNTGSVDVEYSAPVWLQFDWSGGGLENPSGTATFGQFRGHDKVIYWREVF